MGLLSGLFKKKDAEKHAQVTMPESAPAIEIPWGTPQPVMLLIGGQMARVRVWGKFALTVEVADESVTRQARMFIVLRCQDALGEMAAGVGSVAELTANPDTLAEQIQTRAAGDLAGLGLTLSNVVVEGVQGM